MPVLRVERPVRELRGRERALVDALSLDRGSEERIEGLLLATADGRLVREGCLLESRTRHGTNTLVWTDLDLIGERGRIADTPPPPLRANDLPPGPVRDRLAALIGDRALLAVARLRRRRRTWQARDAHGKIVLRVLVDSAVECGHADDSPGAATLHRLPGQIHVEALRGYQTAFDAARAVVESWTDIGIDPAPWGIALLEIATMRADGTPALPSASEAGSAAAEGFRRVFRGLLAAIEANVPGAAAGLDPEYLHDLRVAIRRTRTLLAASARVMARAPRAHFAAEFRWLGGETSRLRDLDVYLLHFDAFVQRTPRLAAGDLEPLRTLLLQHQIAERERVARALRSDRALGLLVQWHAALQPDASATWHASRATTPLARVAVNRVRRAEHRVLALGRTIDGHSADARLHELRKRAKKLRYLLEFFGDVIDPHASRVRITELKALQDLLGAHQDRAVQIAALGHFAQELSVVSAAGPAGTSTAIGALVGRLDEERRQLRTDFTARFAAYDDEDARQAFRTVLDRVTAESKA